MQHLSCFPAQSTLHLCLHAINLNKTSAGPTERYHAILKYGCLHCILASAVWLAHEVLSHCRIASSHALCGHRSVLATEVSKPAVAAAGENLAANGVGNVAIARLTAEELGTAWRGERSFERLRLAGVDLAVMNFSTILVSTDGAPPAVLLACWVVLACRGTLERLRLAGVDLAAMSFSTILVSAAGPHHL